MADFTIGDYAYTDFYDGTVSAQVVDKTKTSYSDIPSTVSYGGSTYTVVSVFTCFMDCTNLVTPPAMPSSVRDMSSCFYGCTSLKNPPVIPSTVISMNTCFYNCTSLETAPVLPSDITNLTGVFTNCTSLVTPPTIPSGVTWMRECFKGCSNLESPPNIPNGVSGNGLISCFDRCTSLTTAPTLPSGITSLESCFFRCETITTAPEIPSGVTSMRNCFYGCVNLQESPDIPSSVTNMVNCFRDCSNLTIGKISNRTTMMSNCFKGCTSLVTVPTIPVTVKLMDYCFDGCTSLTSVSILSNNVTNLQYCFNNCTSLTTAPTIPSSVTNLDHCFSNCASLATAPAIPSSVTRMTYCFMGCRSLTTAPTIPNGITSMDYCFESCYGLTTVPEIPSNVSDLEGCFGGCSHLTGDVFVNNNPNAYNNIFTNTAEPIRIVPQYSTISQEGVAKWTVIADAYNNVTIFVPSLSFQTLSTYRVDSSGSTTLAEEGSYVLLEAVYAFVGLTGDVVTKVVKSNGATISPTWSETTTDGVTTARAWVHQDVDDQAIYAVTLSDIYNHAETRSFTVTRVEALLDFLNGNQGMGLAIGTIATQPGFHCALKSQFEDDLVAPDMTSEELSDFLEDLTPGGTQPSVIRTIHTEVVTASINKAFANYVSVTAPAVENYRFLCWSEVSTRGWVGSVYPEYTTRQTTNMRNATSGQSGTGTIDCTALYIPLYYATTVGEADKVDFIVEQGTSGIWTYRKWDSGISECWGAVSKTTSYAVWTSPVYYGTTYTGNQTYPTNLFISEPSVTASIQYGGGADVWLGMDSQNPGNETKSPSWYPLRINTSGQANYKVGIYAKGRWK